MRVAFCPFTESKTQVDHTLMDSVLQGVDFHTHGLELIKGNSISEPGAEFLQVHSDISSSSDPIGNFELNLSFHTVKRDDRSHGLVSFHDFDIIYLVISVGVVVLEQPTEFKEGLKITIIIDSIHIVVKKSKHDVSGIIFILWGILCPLSMVVSVSKFVVESRSGFLLTLLDKFNQIFLFIGFWPSFGGGFFDFFLGGHVEFIDDLHQLMVEIWEVQDSFENPGIEFGFTIPGVSLVESVGIHGSSKSFEVHFFQSVFKNLSDVDGVEGGGEHSFIDGSQDVFFIDVGEFEGHFELGEIVEQVSNAQKLNEIQPIDASSADSVSDHVSQGVDLLGFRGLQQSSWRGDLKRASHVSGSDVSFRSALFPGEVGLSEEQIIGEVKILFLVESVELLNHKGQGFVSDFVHDSCEPLRVGFGVQRQLDISGIQPVFSSLVDFFKGNHEQPVELTPFLH